MEICTEYIFYSIGFGYRFIKYIYCAFDFISTIHLPLS